MGGFADLITGVVTAALCFVLPFPAIPAGKSEHRIRISRIAMVKIDGKILVFLCASRLMHVQYYSGNAMLNYKLKSDLNALSVLPYDEDIGFAGPSDFHPMNAVHEVEGVFDAVYYVFVNRT